MTLKEKFHQWLRTEPFNLRDAVSLREAQCEVIADEFAIGFAEWVMNNCDEFPKQDQNLILRVFKKEKGL
jgi:hypothetical protein